MRSVLPALIALVMSGGALAQVAPRVTIEDDVASANALKCAALRLAQSEVKPDPMVEAARDAWLRSGVDAERAKAEAAKVATHTAEQIAAMSDDCAPFEIRSAPAAGG